MKKEMEFTAVKELREENNIEKTLNAQFELPDVVEKAKQEAYGRIREMQQRTEDEKCKKTETERESEWKNTPKQKNMPESHRKHKKVHVLYRTAAAAAAAAAVFSGVCITNPAFAANVPVVGRVFEQIGSSLGFSGDYSGYAKTLTDETMTAKAEDGSVQVDYETNGEDMSEESGDSVKTDKTDAGDTLYSKTVDGVTVTLSEVYCNDAAMYVSMVVKSKEPLPNTMETKNGVPLIDIIDSEMKLSYNPGFQLMNAYLDGKMTDEYTYAGVLRVDMEETTVNEEGYAKFYKARNAFLKEKGFDLEKDGFGGMDPDEIAAAAGLESFKDESFKAVGIDVDAYAPKLQVPEKFTVDLNIRSVCGKLPQDQWTTPELPSEFRKAYDKAMAEKGLDEADYENFTEEEEEIEHKLFTEMWNKYYEKYPQMRHPGNGYDSWFLEGPWDFSFTVEQNLSRNETKEINLLDADGYGITSVTKTPFEFTIETNDPEARYAAVMLDADGDMLDSGNFGGSMNTLAIQNRDVSTVYVYLCDYYEYMNELKGYYWSPDYETKKQEKTWKELLDERAVLKTEIVF